MKVRLAFLVSVTLLSSLSCAFREPTANEPGPAGAAITGIKVALSWPSADSTRAASEPAVRALTESSATVYGAQEPVTLPKSVPASLGFVVDLPGGALKDGVSFLKARVVLPSRRIEVSSQVLREEAGEGGFDRLTFSVSGLNAVLPSDRSAQGFVEVEIFSLSKRIATLALPVRTPPSLVALEVYDLSEWTRLADEIGEAARAPRVLGSRLNLIRVLELANNEEIPIEIRLPRRPEGALLQWTGQLSHRDLGCEGPGYAVDQSPSWETLSQDVILLSLGERAFLQAEELIRNPELRDDLFTKVSPGERALVGIYAVGAGSDAWLDRGPQGSALHQVTVPSNCYAVCVERECVGRNTPKAVCYCSRYEDRRHQAQITLGVNRGAVVLRVPPEKIEMHVRYADLGLNQDAQIRSIPHLAEQQEIGWSQ